MWRSTNAVTGAISGNVLVSKVPQVPVNADAETMRRGLMHVQAALATSWNQSLDAVFQPVIKLLQSRGL
jgi:hypothetical protein